MGYGTRAMQLLIDYYSGRICSSIQVSADAEVGVVTMDAESAGLLHEVIAPRQSLPPLLSELGERKPESLDYVGVCFGLTSELLRYETLSCYLTTHSLSPVQVLVPEKPLCCNVLATDCCMCSDNCVCSIVYSSL